MSNPTGSDYLLQNAVLKELARPSYEQASVSLEKPAVEYAAGRANSGADAVAFSNDLNFKKNALAENSRQFTAKSLESERQFLAQLLNSHDQLSTWSKQNDLATLIAAGSVPVQAVSMYKQNQSTDKQNALTQELINSNKANIQAVSLAQAARAQDWQDFLNRPSREELVSDLLAMQEEEKPANVFEKLR